MKEGKINISTKTIRLTGIVFCIVFGLTFGFLAVFTYSREFDAQGQLKQKQAYLLRLEDDVRDFRKVLRNYKEEIEQFSQILFSDRDIANFLEEFGKFAQEAEVKITDMKVQRFQSVIPMEKRAGTSAQTSSSRKKQEEGLSLFSMPIKVVVQGNFEHIVDFLLFLEKYHQLLTLSNVNIKRRTYPLLECMFTLRLYSLKQLEEISKK